jgi:hypothetical protein
MLETFDQSLSISIGCWRVLRKDRELIVYPLLSGMASLLLLAGFLAPLLLPAVRADGWAGGLQQVGGLCRQSALTPAGLAIVFAYYLCNYTIIYFFNSALVACAMIRFAGPNPTLRDGFAWAWRRLPHIVGWALVSATLGVALRLLESRSNSFLTRLMVGFLGATWTVATYFIVPVLVVENVGPFAALARSLAILRQAWGQATICVIGNGTIRSLLLLPAFVVLPLTSALRFSGATDLAIVVGFVLWVGFVCLFFSALDGILVAALYRFAVLDDIAGSFDESDLSNAFGR